jgi:hypothetical protein
LFVRHFLVFVSFESPMRVTTSFSVERITSSIYPARQA